jgi:hypothetical protein
LYFSDSHCKWNIHNFGAIRLPQGKFTHERSKIMSWINTSAIKRLMRVSILFFWVLIDKLIHDGDDLYFYVGVVLASFPISKLYICSAWALEPSPKDTGLIIFYNKSLIVTNPGNDGNTRWFHSRTSDIKYIAIQYLPRNIGPGRWRNGHRIWSN